MGCINTKVAPIPENIRIRTEKERKMLKKALKKQGITAKVTKSGIAFEIPISGDFRRAKLPPIGKSMGKREHTHSSATDVIDTEIKRKFLKFIICFVSLKFSFCDANYTFSYFHFLFRSYSYIFFIHLL